MSEELVWIWDRLTSQAGVLAVLCVVLWGGFRQWWVFGHHYLEMRQERDTWRGLCLSGHDLSKTAVNILRAAGPSPE